MARNRTRLERTLRILHVAWALPCAVVSVILVTSTGGHPPGLVFLPVAIVVWAGGHASLWGVGRLAHYGASRRGVSAGVPPSVVAALVLSGLAAFAGLYLVLAALITGRGPSGALEFAGFVAIWLAHLAAFTGLLLRTVWGRYMAAACGAGWVFALAFQIVDHVSHGRTVNATEAVVVAVIALFLVAVAYRMVLGSGERNYTAPRDDGAAST